MTDLFCSCFGNLLGRLYQLMLVLHYVGNCKLLNGTDVPLHVVEVDKEVSRANSVF